MATDTAAQLSEDFIAAIASEFEKHGAEAIARVREESPATFLELVAGLIPREFVVTHEAGDAFVALLRAMQIGQPSGD
jgi:hypothetical protein